MHQQGQSRSHLRALRPHPEEEVLLIHGEVGLEVDVADPAGLQPTGIGEGDALEAKVVNGFVEGSLHGQQPLDHGNRHQRALHDLPISRHVMHGGPGSVEVPLARLVQQFDSVLDVSRQIHLHAFLQARDGEVRLQHGDQGAGGTRLDLTDLADGALPLNVVHQFNVAGVAPTRHPGIRGRIGAGAGKLRAGQRSASSAPGTPAIHVELTKVAQVRARRPAVAGAALPCGDLTSSAHHRHLARIAAIDHVTAAGA